MKFKDLQSGQLIKVNKERWQVSKTQYFLVVNLGTTGTTLLGFNKKGILTGARISNKLFKHRQDKKLLDNSWEIEAVYYGFTAENGAVTLLDILYDIEKGHVKPLWEAKEKLTFLLDSLNTQDKYDVSYEKESQTLKVGCNQFRFEDVKNIIDKVIEGREK